MCGRFQLALTWTQLVELYGLTAPAPDSVWSPSWSVCPTHLIPAVRHVGGARRAELVRWGFPMPWLARDGKDPWSRALINARSEEAASKRTWSGPLRRDRRVVPATSWIEWIKRGGRRLPVGIARADEAPLHLAAIADRFDREGEMVTAVSLLTKAADPSIRGIHDRMPVLVPDDRLGSGPVPESSAWSPPELSVRALPTSLNKAGYRSEPPEPADWSL